MRAMLRRVPHAVESKGKGGRDEGRTCSSPLPHGQREVGSDAHSPVQPLLPQPVWHRTTVQTEISRLVHRVAESRRARRGSVHCAWPRPQPPLDSRHMPAV